MDLVTIDCLDGEIYEYTPDEDETEGGGRHEKTGLEFHYCPFCGTKNINQ